MEIRETKLSVYFNTLERLITLGYLKKGKDYKLIEEANGLVLVLNLESIHPKYQREVMQKAEHFLPLMDLRSLISATSSFIKYESVVFQWKEYINNKIPINHVSTVCALSICYDTLKRSYAIDYEKYGIPEFETAILRLGIKVEDIDEIKIKGRTVIQAIGFIEGNKVSWNSTGKCFMKSGSSYPRYNLKF